MRFKLIPGSTNDIKRPKETVLLNRGIVNPQEYLNLNDSVLYDWSLLDNIQEAISCLLKHLNNNSYIHILVDCDCDGYTSAAMLYKYLKLLNSNVNVSYSLHRQKQHGISDDIQIPQDINLLIVPDAGTNDVQQCQKLQEKNIDIIILDHHIIDVQNPYAIVVNCQMGNYLNTNLSGAGVTYKFLQALDEAHWVNYANNFLDLVALGNIADCMDIKSYETKRLIEKGLNKIKNKLLQALINKQSYSMNNIINIISVQWYVVPLINAMIRSGDSDEKELMFKAFVEEDEWFKYKPRKKSKDDPEPIEILEDIYSRVARLCGNAKARQAKLTHSGGDKIDELIYKNNFHNNKIIFANVTDILDENMTGMVAIKIAEKYNKPCVLLRKKDNDCFSGSSRNIDDSPIENFKDFLENTQLFKYCTGHQGAFGVGIAKENIPLVIQKTNELLKDVDFSHCYAVDFILDSNELNIKFIKDMNDLKNIYGQGLKESFVVIKNISVNKQQIELMGKEKNTWKFYLNDEIAFVKFQCTTQDEILTWLNSWDSEQDEIIINVIGTVGVNNFKGILTCQVIVEQYEIGKDDCIL
jgi:single-stranded-DNA-specific exonuclease